MIKVSLTIKELNGKKFELIPEGSYPAVCYGIIDEGKQYNEKYNKWTSKIRIMWEISELTVNVDGKEIPRIISKSYTASLNEKSNLRRDLISWQGRQFNIDELLGYNMECLLGKPCLLQIIHNKKPQSSEKFAAVAGVMKLPKEINVPIKINDNILFSFEKSNVFEELEKLPQWLQEIIKKSKDYIELLN